MKAIKRTVAALLATLMLATSTSFTLAAEEYSDKEAVVVAKVNAAGIMTGTDKGFEPSKTLTRAEAAAIMVRMKGISEATVKQNAGTTLFSDVAASNWASGYVNVASNYGIIKGVGANMFAPDKEVSVAEFYTMAVRALNAGQLVDAEGTWPTNYVNFAIENGLAEDVAQIYTATATRMTAATIAANTLEAKMWAKKSVRTNQEITWEETEDILAEKLLGLTIRQYDNTAKKYISLTLPVNTVSNIDKLINGNVEVADSVDLSNIKVGMTYECWLNKDDEICGLWIPENNDSVEFTEIKKMTTTEITLVVDGKEKKYDINSAALPVVVINEAKKTVSSVADLYTAGSPDTGFLVPNKNLDGVAYVDDGDLKQIYMTTFDHYGIVDEVSSKRVTFKSNKVVFADAALKAEPIRLDKEDYEYFLTKDGKAMSFTDLKEDDAIRYYTYGDKIVAEVISSVAEGEITNVNTTDYFVKVDGTKYDYVSTLTGLDLEDEVILYANQANKVVMYQEVEEAASSVAIIKSMRNIKNKYSEETVEVVLAYLDGTTSDVLTLDVEETLKKNGLTATGVTKAVEASKVMTLWNDGAATAKTFKLGQPVCYTVNGSEVVFKAVVDEYTALKATDTLNIKENSKSFVTVDGVNAYVNADTKFVLVKSDKDYAYKIEMVKFEDLDYTTTNLKDSSSNAIAYAVNYDADNKSVDAVIIIADTLPRAKESNYGYITRVSEIKYEDKAAVELDVIFADGTTDTLIANKAESGDDYATDFVKNTAWDFSLNGKLVTTNSTAVTAGDLAANSKVADIDFDHNEIKLDGASTWYQFAEDVLVICKDGSKYTVKDLADIDEFVTGDTEYSKIFASYKDKDDDNNDQVVIIIYEDVK